MDPAPSQQVSKPTPVRVRGKRKASSSPGSVPVSPDPHNMRRSLGSVLASRSIRQRATLESLPEELLEAILLYSINLSLPHASPVIGLKLSSRATLVRLILLGFRDTWERVFSLSRLHVNEHVCEPRIAPNQPQFPPNDDHVLQTSLLGLPWAKLDILLQAREAWADCNARKRWDSHSLWDFRAYGDQGGFNHSESRACFENDYQQALECSRTHLCSMCEWGSFDAEILTRIPDKLIAGPWDTEMSRRLFWFVRGGAMFDEDAQGLVPWEAKVQAIENAVIFPTVPNTFIISCLFRLGVFDGLPDEVSVEWMVKVEWRMIRGENTDSPETKEVLRIVRHALYDS